MPQVPTYIRQGDWNKYIAIQSQGNWPEFIHNALNNEPLKPVRENKVTLPDIKPLKVIKTPQDAQKASKKLVGTKEKLCKHGNPLGQCLDKQSDRSCKA